mmetsp:Transcript_53168/g.88276  ORF Transcript_53168/g.88276 Transcript_53168/m.88276 type:complete len:156 (+) Transcript_53168:99-566(+)
MVRFVSFAQTPLGWRVAVYSAVSCAQACAMLPVICAFTCIFIFVNNSVPQRHRGKLNGLAQACVAIARVCSPLVTSNIFASSTSNELSWPLNYHLCFYMLATIALLALALARRLPESIERQVLEVEPTVLASTEIHASTAQDTPQTSQSMLLTRV